MQILVRVRIKEVRRIFAAILRGYEVWSCADSSQTTAMVPVFLL